ncbi:MAG: porin [Caldimonas sp.]
MPPSRGTVRGAKVTFCPASPTPAEAIGAAAARVAQNGSRRRAVRRFGEGLATDPTRVPAMLRSCLVAAVASLLCAAGFDAGAQNAPTLYGLLDASASRIRPLGGGDNRWQLDSGSMSGSFIGFRGSDDLGGGLRAVYRLESYVRVDTGSSGRNATDAFFSHDANVGLSGAFGTTVIGRNVTPLYLATIAYNPFGESFGFSPSTRQWYAGAVLGDRSWSNSLAYTNNATDAPLRLRLAANFLEDAPGSGRNVGGSAAYASGPFSVVLAGERIKNSPLPLPAGFRSQTAYMLGGTYDFGIVRVYAQAGRVRTHASVAGSDSRTTLGQIGATLPLGNGVVLVAYGRSRMQTSLSRVTDEQASLGYDYFLSKNTDIYLAGLYEKTYQLSSGNAIAGGVRLRF